MTSEAKAALIELSHLPSGRSFMGCGPPGALVRELVAEDCIEIKTVVEEVASSDSDSRVLEAREYWYAELTPRGRKLS